MPKLASILTAFLLSLALATARSEAQTFSTIYNFTGKADGAYPQNGVILANGVLYGGTDQNAHSIYTGNLFTVNPGTGKFTKLFAFSSLAQGVPAYNITPTSSGTVFGVADGGGDVNCGYGQPGTYGCGSAWSFEQSTGKLAVLHRFKAFPDGEFPLGPLAIGSADFLYGTTLGGGGGYGTVFRLNPATPSFKTIHNFSMAEGIYPAGSLLLDTQGNIYGENTYGGNCATCGTVFKLSPSGKLTVLWSFSGSDGQVPSGGLTAGPNGVLYGVTGGGGKFGWGTVFKLSIAKKDLTTLYSFSGGSDGANPTGRLFWDGAGELYGTTAAGGSSTCEENGANQPGCGTIFELEIEKGRLITLHTFSGPDGTAPDAGLAFDGKTTFYGSTIGGGSQGYGSVFSIQP